MRLEHHLVGGYVRYISPHIIIIIIIKGSKQFYTISETHQLGINKWCVKSSFCAMNDLLI